MPVILNKDEAVNLTKVAPGIDKINVYLDYRFRLTTDKPEAPAPELFFESIAINANERMRDVRDYGSIEHTSPSKDGNLIARPLNPATLELSLNNMGDIQEVHFFASVRQPVLDGKKVDIRMPQFEFISIVVVDQHNGEEVARYSLKGAAADAQAVSLLLATLEKSQEGYWKFVAWGNASDLTIEHYLEKYCPQPGEQAAA